MKLPELWFLWFSVFLC